VLEAGPPENDDLLEQIAHLEGELAALVQPPSATYGDDELGEIEAKLNQLHTLKQTLDDQSKLGLQRKDHIAKENIIAAWVNVGLSVTGILLATMGLMLLVATTIAAPPLVGIILAGIGVGLSLFGLFKLGIELNYSLKETDYVERRRDAHHTSSLEKAFKLSELEQQVTLELAIDVVNDPLPQRVPNTVVEFVSAPHLESEGKSQTQLTKVGFYTQTFGKIRETDKSEVPTLNRPHG
jgi:hypothetical protein